MAGRKKSIDPVVSDAVRVRRSYFDCRYGQLHVRTAFSSSGGFDEHTTVLCLHRAASSSRAFTRFLPELARDRSAYAPDLPGLGESDAPSDPPSIADYAAAMGDFLDAMRFRQIDVLGHRSGALIAAELAIQRPEQVRRLVLVSVPAAAPDEGAARPIAAVEDGSHLPREWQRTFQGRDPSMTLEGAAEEFAERLRNGVQTSWAATAARDYPAAARLPLVRQPTLVLRPKDEHWDTFTHVRHWMRGARAVDLPDQGSGLFALVPELVAHHAREFLS